MGAHRPLWVGTPNARSPEPRTSPERPTGPKPTPRARNDYKLELKLELLIQTQMTQKPMLRAEVGMRVRCANKASAE